MSEEFQEKTEEATPKKLADARKKGQVSRSQELSSALMLLVGMLGLFFLGTHLFDRLRLFLSAVFLNLSIEYGSIESVTHGLRHGLWATIGMVLPLLLMLFVVGFFSAAMQVGFTLSFDPLKPKWKTLNLFDPSNYKRYFNAQVFVRAFLGVGKIAVVSMICYLMIWNSLPELVRLSFGSTADILIFISWNAFLIGVVIGLLLLSLGAIDFAFQKWKFKRDLRMTKQEVKDERKQTEGDAYVKQRMRSMMQGFTRNRMKENVPQADVVVANPVHFAVALKYDSETMAAPICVAKGARRTALFIKELASDSQVPIVENPPLAQALYKTVEIGMPVPADLYHGVAEVLAYVYRLNEQMSNREPAARR